MFFHLFIDSRVRHIEWKINLVECICWVNVSIDGEYDTCKVSNIYQYYKRIINDLKNHLEIEILLYPVPQAISYGHLIKDSKI